MTRALKARQRSAAVFLDRDGVIVDLVPDPRSGTNESPYCAADVQLVAGAAEGLRALRRAGFLLVAASNQPAVAKGTVSMEELQATHGRAAELLRREGIELDGWRYCLHHPHGVVVGLSGACACRKPKAGLLLAAAVELELDLAHSWMIGDASTDVEAGHAAGCTTILLDHPGSPHRRPSGARTPDYHGVTLVDAARIISSELR